jgi:hypothetical protein
MGVVVLSSGQSCGGTGGCLVHKGNEVLGYNVYII